MCSSALCWVGSQCRRVPASPSQRLSMAARTGAEIPTLCCVHTVSFPSIFIPKGHRSFPVFPAQCPMEPQCQGRTTPFPSPLHVASPMALLVPSPSQKYERGEAGPAWCPEGKLCITQGHHHPTSSAHCGHGGLGLGFLHFLHCKPQRKWSGDGLSLH